MKTNPILTKTDLSSLLRESINSETLSPESVLDLLASAQKEQVKKLHPYAITPPAGGGGRWQTWYKESGGKRRNVKAQTEDQLWDKLVPLYFPASPGGGLTFHRLYEEWLDYKQTLTGSPNTIKRHRQHYRRYFERSALHSRNICRLDVLLLETECNRIIREFNLSRKEWCNAKTILNGMFSYAVRKKYLGENPMSSVQILVKYRQVVRKTGKTETYNSDELEKLNEFLDQMYAETGDSACLAIKINFMLGLRVGELVALKWEDFADEKHLHIVREEVRNQVTNQICVVEHTKTHKDRFIALIPRVIEHFNGMERQGDYIFMRNGKRITAGRIASLLRKYARSQGVPVKSSHKIRKTFASNLNAAGVPLDCIRELLGHSSLSTTLGYIYNPLTEDETYQLLVNALQTTV